MTEPTKEHVEKVYINYGIFSIMVDSIINKIKDLDFNYIYGIPKGGLFLAVIIANTFKKPLIDNHTYKMITDTSKVLIVDDICDTGETLEKYNSTLPFVTLVAKFKGIEKISNLIYEKKVSDNTWVIFPWESHLIKGNKKC